MYDGVALMRMVKVYDPFWNLALAWSGASIRFHISSLCQQATLTCADSWPLIGLRNDIGLPVLAKRVISVLGMAENVLKQVSSLTTVGASKSLSRSFSLSSIDARLGLTM